MQKIFLFVFIKPPVMQGPVIHRSTNQITARGHGSVKHRSGQHSQQQHQTGQHQAPDIAEKGLALQGAQALGFVMGVGVTDED